MNISIKPKETKMNKKNIFVIIFCILFIGIVVSGIYSVVSNCTNFFTVNISQTITLLSTLLIAFLATQYLNSVRKQKEHIERIILKLQEIVADESFYHFLNDDNNGDIQKSISMNNRKISNYLGVLKHYEKSFKKLKPSIEYIEKEFNDYKEDTGEHKTDLSYLSKSESRYIKTSNNICSKCEYIILLLYK